MRYIAARSEEQSVNKSLLHLYVGFNILLMISMGIFACGIFAYVLKRTCFISTEVKDSAWAIVFYWTIGIPVSGSFLWGVLYVLSNVLKRAYCATIVLEDEYGIATQVMETTEEEEVRSREMHGNVLRSGSTTFTELRYPDIENK